MATSFPIPDHDREELARCGVGGRPGCGPGWWPLVALLVDDIRAYNTTAPNPTDRYPRGKPLIRVSQIKEKYGTLRFYAEGVDSARLTEAIEAAEYVSGFLCESCGRPGIERTIGGVIGGWVVTTCDPCAQNPSRQRASAADLAADAPPIFLRDDPRWWASESLWPALAFAAQSRDPETRSLALDRMAWLAKAKRTAEPKDWKAREQLDEWALAMADAGTAVPTPAYPEPLHTMMCVLATGHQPDGTPAAPDQVSLLLRHPRANIRVAAQMSLAARGRPGGARGGR